MACSTSGDHDIVNKLRKNIGLLILFPIGCLLIFQITKYKLIVHGSYPEISGTVSLGIERNSLKNYNLTNKTSVPLFPWRNVSDPDNWQTVIRNVCYVYSAHLYRSSNNSISIIRIVGTLAKPELRNQSGLSLYCKVWIRLGSENDTTTYYITRVKRLSRLAGIKHYSNVQYICELNISKDKLVGAAVSLIHHHDANANNFMLLHQDYLRGVQYEYTVCIEQPLYGNLQASWFVEYIEANILFGAQYILVYNRSLPHTLDPYVGYYTRKGLVKVLPWQFPDELEEFSEDGMHMHLQQSMITDCQLRTQIMSKYLVLADFDELIVPRHPDDFTWADMMRRSGCHVDVIAYVVRHLYFGLEMQNSVEHQNNRMEHRNNSMEHRNNSRVDGIMTLDRTQRSQNIFAYPMRTKYIANTLLAGEILTHVVRVGKGKPACVLHPDIGGLHHYRNRILHVFENSEVVTDNTMFKYAYELKKSIWKAKRQMNRTFTMVGNDVS